MNRFFYLTILHVFNDGFEGSLLLLLPFISHELHINLAQVGMLGTAEGMMEILFSLPSIYFAAKYGSIRILLMALGIYTTGFILTSISPTLLLLFITFIIAGIGFGLFHSIAFGLISEWSEKSNRGRQLANFTASGDLGKIALTTVLTLIIGFIGWRYTAFLYGAAALLCLVIFLKFHSSSEKFHTTKNSETVSVPMRDFFTNVSFVFANLVNIFDTLASTSLYIFLPFLLIKRGIHPSILGAFTAMFFLGNFLGKTFLGRMVDKYGNTKIFIISEIFMAIFIFILANSLSPLIIFGAAIALGIFTKGTVPVVKSMISESVEHHQNFDKAFGINTIIASAAAALAPLILGFLSNTYGIVLAFNFCAISAVIAIIPATLYQLVYGRLPKPQLATEE